MGKVLKFPGKKSEKAEKSRDRLRESIRKVNQLIAEMKEIENNETTKVSDSGRKSGFDYNGGGTIV